MAFLLYENLMKNGVIFNKYFYQMFKLDYTDKEKIQNLLKDTQQNIHLIRSQSRYDYGYNVGSHFKYEYKILNRLFKILELTNINDSFYIQKSDINKNLQYSDIEEFKGLSDSTDIKIDRLLNIHNVFFKIFGSICTSLLITGKATKNNETFLIQNMDGGLFLTSLIRSFTYKVWMNESPNSYRYIYFGIPIIFEIPLINQKGLGLGQTATICNKKRYHQDMHRDGVNINFLIRDTMKKCKNVNEVVHLWNDTKIAFNKLGNEIEQSTAWCDKKGGIVSIEIGPDLKAFVSGKSTDVTRTKEDMLWHARHHQWLDGRITGSYLPSECHYSILDANRAKELLEMHYGNITLEICKEIARDHGKNQDAGLCKHPLKNGGIFTCCSYIVHPDSMTVYLTHSAPCKTRFIKYDFRTKLNEQ